VAHWYPSKRNRSRPPDTVKVIDVQGNTLSRAMFRADPDQAHAILAAAASGNAPGVDRLFLGMKDRETVQGRAVARERLPSPGGATSRQCTAPDHNFLGNKMPSTSDDPAFKAFGDVSSDNMPPEPAISRRMLRQLEDIDQSTTRPDQLGCTRGLGVQHRRARRRRTRDPTHRIEETTPASELSSSPPTTVGHRSLG
jgi:hypothetical protein